MSFTQSSVPTVYFRTNKGTVMLWALVAAGLALAILWGLDSMTREDVRAAEMLQYEATARALAESVIVAIMARTAAHPFAERFWLGPPGSGTTSLTFQRGSGPIAEPPGTSVAVPWNFTATVEDRDAPRERYRVHIQITIGLARYTYGYGLSRTTTPIGDLPARCARNGIRLPEGIEHATLDAAIDAAELTAAQAAAGTPAGTLAQLAVLDADLSQSAACINVPVGPASQTTAPAILCSY
jgi:hypothetical protein